MNDIQDLINTWHRAKYPVVPIERVGLKLGEEAGEVQQAIDRIIWSDGADYSHMVEEIGDVGIVLCVLAGRFAGKSLESIITERAIEKGFVVEGIGQ